MAKIYFALFIFFFSFSCCFGMQEDDHLELPKGNFSLNSDTQLQDGLDFNNIEEALKHIQNKTKANCLDVDFPLLEKVIRCGVVTKRIHNFRKALPLKEKFDSEKPMENLVECLKLLMLSWKKININQPFSESNNRLNYNYYLKADKRYPLMEFFDRWYEGEIEKKSVWVSDFELYKITHLLLRFGGRLDECMNNDGAVSIKNMFETTWLGKLIVDDWGDTCTKNGWKNTESLLNDWDRARYLFIAQKDTQNLIAKLPKEIVKYIASFLKRNKQEIINEWEKEMKKLDGGVWEEKASKAKKSWKKK